MNDSTKMVAGLTVVAVVLAGVGWKVGNVDPEVRAEFGAAAFPATPPLTPTSTTTTTVKAKTSTLSPAVRLDNAFQATPTVPPPSTVPVPDWARCPQHWQTAVEVGWPEDELWHLDRIWWLEARCDPNAYNGNGGDRSHGLMQVNVKKSSGNQSLVGPLVDWDWSRLFDPATNLRVGLHIATYVESELGWCKWRPWTTRGSERVRMSRHHFTCEHGHQGIESVGGVVHPRPQPLLGDIMISWWTDDPGLPAHALGLQSTILDCDRTEFHYVAEFNAVPWIQFRSRLLPRYSASVSKLEYGRSPRHWFVSTDDVLARLEES